MEQPLKRRSPTDYVNNKSFLEALVAYKSECNKAYEEGVEPPRVTPYIGECIYEICTRMARRPNFSGYSSQWKDEMISDALLNCLAAVENFNPERSTNPFGYYSQIVWNAFIRRIKTEKSEQYARHKHLQMLSFMESDELAGMLDLESHNFIIENYEATEKKNKEAKNAKSVKASE